MIGFLFCFAVLVGSVLAHDSCSLENTLCSLCSKRQKGSGDLSEIQKDIRDLKKARSPVAFFAYRSGNFATKSSSIKHTTIVYDKVNLNLGNGYNEKTGKFTAPSDGLYLFHVSTGVVDHSWASMELVRGHTVEDIGFPDSGNHADRNHVTTATPLYLKKGDVIYVRIGNTNGGSYIESNTYIRTSFSGTRIN